MEELALLITMDIEGRLYLEATVPSEFVTQHDGETTDIRIPLPRNIAPKLGRAIIEAAASEIGVEYEQSKLN